MSAEAHQSNRDLLKRAQAGETQARELLVSENIALVKHIVKRFLGRGADYDDLFQYGCIGLVKAIDRFNCDFPVQFSTYAVPLILGEIRRYLRDDGPIHVSRSLQEAARRVEDYINQPDRSGKDCSLEQIAAALNIDKSDVLLAMNCRRTLRSLNEQVGNMEDVRLMDVIGTNPMDRVEQRLVIAKLLQDLPEEDRMLIIRRLQ